MRKEGNGRVNGGRNDRTITEGGGREGGGEGGRKIAQESWGDSK